MADRILIVEQDPGHPAVWRYGLADEHGRLSAPAYQLRHHPDTGSETTARERCVEAMEDLGGDGGDANVTPALLEKETDAERTTEVV